MFFKKNKFLASIILLSFLLISQYKVFALAPPLKNDPDYLSQLPDEVLVKIIVHLDLQSILKLASTNTKFSSLITDNPLWKRLNKKHLGKKFTFPSLDQFLNWKENFRRLYEKNLYFNIPEITIKHKAGVILAAPLHDDTMITACNDNILRTWHLDTTQRLQKFKGHTDRITSIIELHNNNILSASWDKTLKIWNPSNRRVPIHPCRSFR